MKQAIETVSALAERERARDIVAEMVRNSRLPGGYVKNDVNSGPDEYAEALEKLREVLRVPKGENIVTHARAVRALADALIAMQNSTFC